MCATSSEISAWTSLARATSRATPVACASGDVEADVGAAVGLEVGPLSRIRSTHSRMTARIAASARGGGQRGGARLDRQAQVEDLAPVGAQGARRPGQRRLLDDERAAAAAADGAQVPALHERGDRLAQRGARDVELVGELALGGQPRAGGEDAEADGGAQPVDGLLERRERARPARRPLRRRRPPAPWRERTVPGRSARHALPTSVARG